jgi:hypothetical protein
MILFLTFFSDAFRIIWQEDIERSQRGKREMKQDKFSAFNDRKDQRRSCSRIFHGEPNVAHE